jgi:hypothetical protein
MAYKIETIANGAKKLLKTVETVDAAKAFILTMFSDMFIEEDSDNPDHFDVFAYEGAMSEIFSIEPVKE